MAARAVAGHRAGLGPRRRRAGGPGSSRRSGLSTRWRGSSRVIGSWKMSATRSPRARRRSVGVERRQVDAVDDDPAGGGGARRAGRRASPGRASTSRTRSRRPGRRSRPAARRGSPRRRPRTGPRAEAYVTRRSRDRQGQLGRRPTSAAVGRGHVAGPDRRLRWRRPRAGAVGGGADGRRGRAVRHRRRRGRVASSTGGRRSAAVAVGFDDDRARRDAPHAHPAGARSRGLTMSLMPSPSRVSPVTRARMNSPGNSDVHQKPLATSPMAREMS